MGNSEEDTDQKDSHCKYCSGRDSILVYFGSGDLSVPSQPTAAVPNQSESLYTMNQLLFF